MSSVETLSVSGRLAAMTVIIGALLADAKRNHDHPQQALLDLLDDANEQIRRALDGEPAILDLHCREVFNDAANATIVEVGLIAQGLLGDVSSAPMVD
jgi:hypothetical protein